MPSDKLDQYFEEVKQIADRMTDAVPENVGTLQVLFAELLIVESTIMAMTVTGEPDHPEEYGIPTLLAVVNAALTAITERLAEIFAKQEREQAFTEGATIQ